MTPRNLFSIILKIIGIFFIRDLLIVFPPAATLIPTLLEPDEGTIMILILGLIFVIGPITLLIYFLIFKTNWVIEKLKFNDGFGPEPLQFNIHRSTVLNITVIVAGVTILAYAIPQLIRQIVIYIRYVQVKNDLVVLDAIREPDLILFVVFVAELIIGLLMIGSHSQIVNFIELRRKEKTMSNEQLGP